MSTKSKILIVDDSPDLLDALMIFLQDKSYLISTANSKELLQTELKRFKPDVIILDVFIMNMGDGREICRVIKSNTETMNIPVILMSANYQALENFEQCYADAIVEKPFNLKTLLEKIESVLAGSNLNAEKNA